MMKNKKIEIGENYEVKIFTRCFNKESNYSCFR
jgi:hypothetical protein